MKLTKQIIEKYITAPAGNKDRIDFFERNKLLGMPLAMANQLKGDVDDYGGHLQWLSNATFDEDNGLLTSQTKGNLNTFYEYDDHGKLIKDENEMGIVTYEYLDDGSVMKCYYADHIVGDEDDYTIIVTFDEHGRIVKETHGTDERYSFEYDDRGNLVKEEWLLPIEYEYDENDNLIKETIFSLHGGPQSHWYKYDDNNRLIEVGMVAKRDDGHVHTIQRDSHGNPTYEYRNGEVRQWEYTYYDDGQLKSINDFVIPFFEKT